ncbi:hypothetical protein DdX_20701 [Ditylenchus destructor]|uniref:Uncharacterized protein n=1 Tax=Ditylenchus destructor TaxID=166010 RepID=A0AAD4MKB2_9BILA|nr:hypothetical protein DdX_20701 [Ditylenchus destructor]
MKEIAKVQNGDEAELEDETMPPNQIAIMKFAPMALNDESFLLSDFVITFVFSKGNHACLEGDYKFILHRISSNERLSFFTHNQFADNDCDSAQFRAYRLWHRRVVNESEDLKIASHLQNLEEWSGLGIDFDDREFYHFSYPVPCSW